MLPISMCYRKIHVCSLPVDVVTAHGQILLPYGCKGKQEDYLGQQQADIEGLCGWVKVGSASEKGRGQKSKAENSGFLFQQALPVPLYPPHILLGI